MEKPYLRYVTIKTEFSLGSEINSCATDLCILASRLGCDVEAKFNEVLLVARPWTNPIDLINKYHDALIKDKPYKIAVVNE